MIDNNPKQSDLGEKHKFIDVNGIKIHYVELGKGPLILLIHGWNNDWYSFYPLIKKLSGFRIIALDLPGYGNSEELKGEYTVSRMSEIIFGLLKNLDEKPDILCALSMGTVIATDFAVKHPEKFNGLVLIGPPIFDYNRALAKVYGNLMKIIYSNNILMMIAKKFMTSNFYGHFTAKYINMHNYDKDLIDKVGIVGRKKIRARALYSMGLNMYNYHMEKGLRQLKIPTRIILGKFDKIVDLEEAKRIGKELDNISIDWVDNAGHVVSLEKPKEVAEIIEKINCQK